jgi:hypothetical protein
MTGRTLRRLIDLLGYLATFQYVTGSVASNAARLKSLINATQIAGQSETVTFADLGLAMFLNSLPTVFHNTRSILESYENKLDINKVIATLTAEEQRLSIRVQPKFVNNTFTKQTATCSKTNRPSDTCWHCNPSLAPFNQSCKDCGIKGHQSSKNAKCIKNTGKRVLNTNSVTTNDNTEVPFPSYRKKPALSIITHRVRNLEVSKKQKKPCSPSTT